MTKGRNTRRIYLSGVVWEKMGWVGQSGRRWAGCSQNF